MNTFFQGQHWFGTSKRDRRVVTLYSRHYSSVKNGKTIADWLNYGITAPGEVITLLTTDASALFVWLKQKFIANNQTGVNCVVFRNEGMLLSSVLILEAEQFAWSKWPNERLFTYVDPSQIASHNPGFCFKIAGWNLVKDEGGKPLKTSRGLLILEKLPSPDTWNVEHETQV